MSIIPPLRKATKYIIGTTGVKKYTYWAHKVLQGICNGYIKCHDIHMMGTSGVTNYIYEYQEASTVNILLSDRNKT